MPVAKATSSDF